MPLTKEQMAAQIVAAGQNPADYDLDRLDAEGNAPLKSATTTVEQPMSNARAFGLTARRSVIPTIAGGLGTGGALALSSWLGGPVTGIPGTIIGVGGGLLGGLAASKGQEEVLKAVESPEDYTKGQQELQQAHEQHPLTSFVGSTAPMLLLGRPSISGYAAKDGIRNAAVAGGINAATDIGSQKFIEGNDGLDIGRVAGAALTGSLFNKQIGLGKLRAFGGHGTPEVAEEQQNPTGSLLSMAKETPLSNKPIPLVNPKLKVTKETAFPHDYEERIQDEYELGQLKARLEEERIKRNALDKEIADNARDNSGAVLALKDNGEVPPLKSNGLIAPKGLPVQELTPEQQALAKQRATSVSEALKEQQSPTGTLTSRKVNPQKTNMKGVEEANRQNEEEPPTEGEQIQDEYDRGIRYQPNTTNINNLWRDNPDFQQHTQKLADNLGVKLEEVQGLKDSNGNDVAGVSYIKSRIAQINPAKAGVDTGLHEVGHVFVSDLRNSNVPAEAKLYQDGIGIFGTEEKMVEALGLRGVDKVRAALDGSTLGRAKLWMQDFWSHVKYKFGTASEKDISNMLSKKLLHGVDVDASGFSMVASKVLSGNKPLGLVPSNYGTLPTQSVRAKLQKLIPKDEYQALLDSGLDKFIGQRPYVRIDELQKWVNENGPRVEIKKAGIGSMSKEQREFAHLQHSFMDRVPQRSLDDVHSYLKGEIKDTELVEKFKNTQVDTEKLKRYKELNTSPEIVNYKAGTNWQSIAPKAEKDMPGYVEIAVTKSVKGNKDNSPLSRYDNAESIKFPSSHSFPPNTLGWVRGYMDGDTFRIIEVQSDWAQQHRESTEKSKLPDNNDWASTNYKEQANKLNDPLLPHYERLAIKAAINHAIEQGAKRIAIDDSMTAMLTEGHDREVGPEAIDLDYASTKMEAKKLAEKMEERGFNTEIEKNDQGDYTIRWFDKNEVLTPSQAKGMQLHYDEIIPNILRDLTGEKGEVKEFGEHKMAMRDNGSNRPNSLEPRQDLIFRNQDGSPKTTSTARSFGLSTIASRLETDPFTTTGKYQKESSLVAESGDKEPLASKLDRKVLSFLGSATDKIRNLNTPTAHYVADKIDKFDRVYSELQGKYKNGVQNIISSAKLSPASMDRVDTYGREMMASNGKDTSISLTPSEQKVYDNLHNYLVNVADENTVRQIEKNPHYWPAILNKDVTAEWSINPNSKRSLEFQKQWLDYANTKAPNQDNAAILRDYIDAINGKETSLTFGALRKAAGIGLPESMQDNNLASRFSRYGNRVAKDMASAHTFESDPVMRWVLRGKDLAGKPQTERPNLPGTDTPTENNVGTSDAVKKAMQFVNNEFSEFKQPKVKAASRLVTNSLLGTATAVRNIAQLPTSIIAALPSGKDVQLLWKAIPNIGEAWKGSFAINARKEHLGDLEYGDSTNSPNYWLNKFNKLSNFMRVASGREHSEQAERAYSFAVGELAAKTILQRASTGNKNDLAWLVKHSTTVAGGIEQYIGKPSIPDEVVAKIAKSFVDRVSGTYGVRGLPAGSMEGNFAPFFALSRWGLEKSNVIYKDVISPAIHGDNFQPLIAYTLGSFITGSAIRELNELMSGKKSSDPSLKEAIITGHPEQQVRAVVNLLQAASYGGIISDIMKAGSDIGIGHKKPTGGLSFPLADFVSDTIGKNFADYTTAINAGEDKFDTTLQLMFNVLKESVQTVRLVANHTIDSDTVEDQNAYRDVRVFNELEGKPNASSDYVAPNSYLDREAKTFKKEQDVSKVPGELHNLITMYVKQFTGNPEGLRAKLAGLQSNSYQTIPNPDNMPLTANKFMNFVRQTQGPEALESKVTDYQRRNLINKLKSSAVPSV